MELVVEPRGLEPLTPCLQSRCATNCAKAPGGWNCGRTRHGTAGQTRSVVWAHEFSAGRRPRASAQTTPATVNPTATSFFMTPPTWGVTVGPAGLEPATSSLSGKRSNRAELWARNSDELYSTTVVRHESGQPRSRNVTWMPPTRWVAAL